DHGPLSGDDPVREMYDDPVVGLSQAVSQSGVREESAVFPAAAARLVKRQPGFIRRVVTTRRDRRQKVTPRLAAIGMIHFEQFGDGRLANDRLGKTASS